MVGVVGSSPIAPTNLHGLDSSKSEYSFLDCFYCNRKFLDMYPAVQAAYFEASFLKYSFCFQEALYFCVCRHQAALKYFALSA